MKQPLQISFRLDVQRVIHVETANKFQVLAACVSQKTDNDLVVLALENLLSGFPSSPQALTALRCLVRIRVTALEGSTAAAAAAER